jgi:DNA end-binding protein Ku
MAVRSIDKVSISFGLVAIPARIYSTGEPGSDVSFHLVHAVCGTRVKQQWYCPKDDEVVERSDLVKGYEVARGKLVTFEKEELKALEAVASDSIEIREFVPLDAVDPIYYERHYYVGPDKGGDHAYTLLRTAMADSGLVALGSYAARGKQYVVLVRADDHGLVMHQLRYPDEVRGWKAIDLPARAKPKPAELALARKVIDQITHTEADLEDYKDEVSARVRKLIAKKAEGEVIEVPEAAEKPAAVVDLMQSLKESLAAAGNGNGKAKAHAKSHAKPKRAARTRAATAHRPKRATARRSTRSSRAHAPAAATKRRAAARKHAS